MNRLAGTTPQESYLNWELPRFRGMVTEHRNLVYHASFNGETMNGNI